MIENFGDKKNTNGFDKRPEDTIKGGRKPSIKRQLIELLEADGEILIEKKDVIRVYKNGNVKLKLPTEMQLAIKLKQWAMSKRGTDSIKALQIILEQIDGKANQNMHVTTPPTQSKMQKVTLIIKERKLEE
ncbi:hypothetical protein [Flavivirga jejuensis]|uniref:Uncharacterized protein n=1 Tax=Flavivirga jejuensis TaxID=870487 RepID=A0ABT8WKP2_9FLAO|nr:hypothetical protein [Flavivirga jejuensis]MDO5973527.1 hypothetical protein [Flavivirga jejuensis]